MKSILAIFILLFPLLSISQVKEDSTVATKHKFELALNITSTLSNFLGNSNNNSLLSDPYILGLKYEIAKSHYLRSGFNIKSRKVSESFGERIVLENDYRMRIGWEKRFKMAKRFVVYAGLDLVGGYNYSDVKTSGGSFGFASQIITRQTSYGGGPLLGLMFQLNKRVSLSTEASLYYNQLKTYRLLNLGFPNPTAVESTVNGYILLPMIPSSLYIVINF